MSRPKSLAEILHLRAQENPVQTGWTFYSSNEPVAATWADIDQGARKVAGALRSIARPGNRVLLLYPPGLDFIKALFGCFYARVTAVPAFPPDRARFRHALPRLLAVLKDADCSAVLSAGDLGVVSQEIMSLAPELTSMRWVLADAEVHTAPMDRPDPDTRTEDLALIQYTSGSTSTPKGVVLSNGNLLDNSRQIAQAFGHTAQSRGVVWLPPYHDMGLIGGILQPLYVGFPVALLSPLSFLQRPVRWLQMITAHRATTSGAPDFAYRMCVEKVNHEQRAELDLSSWEVAFTGAEPVRASTLERFTETFGECGFRRNSFLPCYGLAEATLIVTASPRRREPVVARLGRETLKGGVAAGTANDLEVTNVSCGSVVPDHQLLIVDPTTRECLPDDRIGEVWMAGASVAQGYWNNQGETEGAFRAQLSTGEDNHYLRTGDLGFLRDGELFLTGRLKNVIVINGRNYYPHDIEETIEEALRPTSTMKFGAVCVLENDGVMSVLVERKWFTGEKPAWSRIADQIVDAVATAHGLKVGRVVGLRPGALPKTSSGKLQRSKAAQMLTDGELTILDDEDRRTSTCSEGSGRHETEAVPSGAGRLGVARWIAAYLVSHLRVEPDRLGPRTPFAQYGIDSIEAVNLAASLGAWIDREVPATVLWDYPNIEALAAYLGQPHGDETQATERLGTVSSGENAIAIVGMDCRFPGHVRSPEEFWAFLSAGGSGIGSISSLRPDSWGRSRAGYLDEVDTFDASFFGITPREAEAMDPQQRLLLEVSWAALERAGLTPEELAGSRTGVFVGISNTDYLRLHIAAGAGLHAYVGTGNANSIVANRLSYQYDLRGPSMAVDTACSSSLVALHLACRSLRSGETDLAIVGGVNLILSEQLTEIFSAAQMLSPDACCKTFAADANGYVRGEGVAALVLKRAVDAERERDPILALVRGSAVTQDGSSNGLTAPNGSAQREVIRAALQDAGIPPASVQYVEAHGTGTPLGDPIEFGALQSVYGERPPQSVLSVGSVKTNIGHLEAAAGIAGVIKTVLALRHRTIPAHLNFSLVNPRIALNPPLRVPAQGEDWPETNGPRRGSVSSFGFGGTNAHVVLEEAELVAPSKNSGPPYLIRVTARSLAALRSLAAAYLSRLRRIGDIDLSDFCRSATAGRAALDYKAFVVAANREGLLEGLSAIAGGKPSAYSVEGHSGTSPLSGPVSVTVDNYAISDLQRTVLFQRFGELAAIDIPRFLSACGVPNVVTTKDAQNGQFHFGTLEEGDICEWLLRRLVALELSGIRIDWKAVDGGRGHLCHEVPTYPFARTQYWIPVSTEQQSPPNSASAYRVQWNPLPTSSFTGITPGCTDPWIITGDAGRFASGLQAAFARRGIRAAFAQPDRITAECSPAGVIYCISQSVRLSDGDDAHLITARLSDALGELRSTIMALIQHEQRLPGGLSITTCGAQQVFPHEGIDPLTASLWGFGRSVAAEHPQLWGKMIDLEYGAEPEFDEIVRALLSPSEDRQLARRAGKWLGMRLVPESQPKSNIHCDSSGTYLITGGTGALGLATARLLVKKGARRLVLISRRPPAPEVLEAIQDLRREGVWVEWRPLEIADGPLVQNLFRELQQSAHPLLGVVHTAGVLDDATVSNLDEQKLSRVLAPKAAGAWNLHRASRECGLDFLIFFSSVSSVIGSPGQSGYAAANAFVDALAMDRTRRGLPGTSVSWGPFAGTGMAGRKNMARQLAARGLPAMDTDVLDRWLCADAAHRTVASVDWARVLSSAPESLVAALAADLAAPAEAEQFAAVVDFAALPPDQRHEQIVQVITEHVARVIGINAAHEIDTRRGLLDIGLDSLMTLELGNRLEKIFRLNASSTLLFNYPTIEKLAAYIDSRFATDEPMPLPRDMSPSDLLLAIETLTDEEVRQLTEEHA